MIPELKKTAEGKMQKSLDALKSDLQKVRTGRAHTGLLDHVQVDYYGSLVPVNQVANITLVDARTIGVQPWEKNMAQKIEKAIRDSDLGLNPASQGELIRVPMPALTEERRKEMTVSYTHLDVYKRQGSGNAHRCLQAEVSGCLRRVGRTARYRAPHRHRKGT